MSDISAIILAGGKSSRMGTDKGLMDFNGKLMISYIIETLNSLQLPIHIISNNANYASLGFPTHTDLIEDAGPVGGIYTGLKKVNSETSIVLSCDVPFVTAELLNTLIEQSQNHDASIAKFQNKLHPLIGVYNNSCTDIFKEHLDKRQYKLMKVCDNLELNIVDFTQHESLASSHFFANINSPKEIAQYQ